MNEKSFFEEMYGQDNIADAHIEYLNNQAASKMDTVKVNISEENHYNSEVTINLPPKGTLIKYKGKKRIYFQVTNIDNSQPYEHTLRCYPVYIPSPKSQLRKKSIFSKFKMKIIN